jgi:glutamate-1-semialdehyde 2,1-aminomutase
MGLEPDLVVMGKIVGGGLPVGVVGGRADILELLSAKRSDSLLHSGTFNGNVITCAAGLQGLIHLTADAIGEMNASATALAHDLEDAAHDAGLPATVTRAGSIVCLHFRERAPCNAAEARERPAMAEWFHLAALLEGVYVPRGGRLFLSTALGPSDLQFATDALARALVRLNPLIDAPPRAAPSPQART